MTSTAGTEIVGIPVEGRPADNAPSSPGTLFNYLDPNDPARARRRFAKLYWVAWRRLVMAFFLSAFGTTFLLIGVGCMSLCTDFGRGVAFFFIGALMAIPGYYAATVLILYLRGRKGFSYKVLPDYE